MTKKARESGVAPSHAAEGNVEVGYGAETHKKGEDFTHRTEQRKAEDATASRVPASTRDDTPSDEKSELASEDRKPSDR